MEDAWRPMFTENGFSYYINEKTQEHQWDHPKFIEIKHVIDDCNFVKYPKYRVALKIRHLQAALNMEHISLSTITAIFDKHKMGINESSLCLENCDLEAILLDIYFAANKINATNIDIDLAVSLMQNFIYNIYDRNRQGTVQVYNIKLVLGLLSQCELNQLYHFIFTLCADHNNCVTRKRLQSLLTKIIDVVMFMHEDVTFGHHLIIPTIEECFINSPGLVGVSESIFIGWLQEGPQLLRWIPTLFRLRLAEQVVHPVKCSTCKMSPIVGLKYRCKKCSNYAQCQRCFFNGSVSDSHKSSHTMKEYCTGESSRNIAVNFFKKLCGTMSNVERTNEDNNNVIETNPLSERSKKFKSTDSNFCNTGPPVEPLSASHVQLKYIIDALEHQNRKIHRILLLGIYNDKEIKKYLGEHAGVVATQVQRLKVLKEYLHVCPQTPPKPIVQSTPMAGLVAKKRTEFDLMSPIPQISERSSRLNSTQDAPYSINDISTWIRDQPANAPPNEVVRKSPVRELHNDLDDALAKLQQILANNFTLDESLGNIDNNHLKNAVCEVEDVLTSFIDTVENSRASSVQPFKTDLQ